MAALPLLCVLVCLYVCVRVVQFFFLFNLCWTLLPTTDTAVFLVRVVCTSSSRSVITAVHFCNLLTTGSFCVAMCGFSVCSYFDGPLSVSCMLRSGKALDLSVSSSWIWCSRWCLLCSGGLLAFATVLPLFFSVLFLLNLTHFTYPSQWFIFLQFCRQRLLVKVLNENKQTNKQQQNTTGITNKKYLQVNLFIT